MTDTNKSSVQIAMTELARVLDEREKDLISREQDLLQKEKALEASYGPLKEASDVIHLNVGGRTDIAVSRRTLTSVEGSLLASMFSGRWDESLPKDANGLTFIDQPADLFMTMVDYLRSKQNDIPGAPALEPPPAEKRFMRMIMYYGITFAIYALEILTVQGGAGDNNIVIQNHPHYSVSCTSNLATFQIQRIQHNLKIESYTIQMGKFSNAVIGFGHHQNISSLSNSSSLGLRDDNKFYAFDCTNLQILLPGNNPINILGNVDVKEGSLIRCAWDKNCCPRFYVDGFLLSTSEEYCTGLRLNKQDHLPCFSINGSIRIVEILYY